MLEKDFKDVINSIKQEIKITQLNTMITVNKSLMLLYFNVGKLISENSKYGNKFIEQLESELRIDFPNLKGFSVRNLKYMQKFYIEYKDYPKVQQLVAQLPRGHNILLMDKFKDIETRNIYAENIISNSWSRNILAIQIDTGFHLRIGKSDNNFKSILPSIESDLAKNTLKDPYIFEFLDLKDKYKECELEELMVQKIRDVLLELGKGFSFVGNQYKISTENKDYYIDLLFYHLDLRCYIVVELKTSDFKPEYTGQLSFYITEVDEILKKETENSTIGLLLCKNKDRLSVEWSLKSVNTPIGVSSFEVNKILSKEILDKLPTEEDINLQIDIEESEEN